MLQVQVFREFQFLDDALGKFLAKFNTPLVEAENIPDNTLYKDLMLV
jgi:hypothetical protein